MRRGDIYWVDFEPVQGSEVNKVRPAVIISNNAANTAAAKNGQGVVTVVPVTTNITRIYPFQVFLSADEHGLEVDSKAQAEQLRAVDAVRLREHVGSLTEKNLKRLDTALRLHLAL